MKKRYAGIACVIISLVIISNFIGPYYNFLLSLAYINVILACSLYAIFRTGLFSLSHAAFMSIGAYSGFLAMQHLDVSFGIAILIGGFNSAIISFFVGYPGLRLKGLYFAIYTLIFVEVVQAAMTWPVRLTGGVQGLTLHGIPSMFGIKFLGVNQQYFMLVFAILVVLVYYRLERSKFGYIFRASGENEELSQSIGINTNRFKLSAFALSGFIVGCTGVLYATTIKFIYPPMFSFMLSVFIFVYILLGGTQNIIGPVLGAIFMTFLSVPFRKLAYVENLGTAIVLMIVILFFPGGLVSLKKQKLIMKLFITGSKK
jgi:branched-chain amino acid transport system permease protein